MITVFLLLSILVTGVNAGVFVAVQIAQVPVQRTLGARDFVLVKKSFELRYGPRMRVLVVASLLAPIPIYVTGGSVTTLSLVAIGHALALAVLVVTAIYNLPVNRVAITWDPEQPPTDWEARRARWHLGNAIRTPIALVAFACLALAAVLD